MGAVVTAGWVVTEQGTYGSLQAAVPLDKERGLALLSGSLLMAALELALPVKVAVLQQMQEQGRTIRAHQREEPDDLQLARQQVTLQKQRLPGKQQQRLQMQAKQLRRQEQLLE